MKKLILLSISLMMFFYATSQDVANNESNIHLTPYVSDPLSKIALATRVSLENKLSQIILTQGLSAGANSRFILAAKVDVLGKEITATAPPLQVYSINLTLLIADGLDGTLFSSYTSTLKGVGETEVKAYNTAFKGLNANNKAYQDFVKSGKEKIVTYYNTHVNQLIKEAQLLASVKKYDQAIYKLAAVPSDASEAYAKVFPIITKLYDQYTCSALDNAKNYWLANQDKEAANKVAELLMDMTSHSSCYKEARSFAETVGKRVYEINKNEWDFLIKIQNEKRTTAQAIGELYMEYVKNQPKVVLNF